MIRYYKIYFHKHSVTFHCESQYCSKYSFLFCFLDVKIKMCFCLIRSPIPCNRVPPCVM
ncbi:unnamed protein product [Tenebrio molitor]|nr:unnamed protein product [Tenebrio molitor]